MKNHLVFLKENTSLEISNLPVESEVIVIVPSDKILFLEADLPPLKGQHFHQALAFALEEQLIEDITQLHFAIGEFNKNQKIPVAIVAKNTLEYWLTILKEANLFPKMLIPDIFVLPVNEEEWQVRCDLEITSIRQGIFKGFSCDTANFTAILQHSQVKRLHIHCLHDQTLPLNIHSLTSIPTQITQYSADDFLELSKQSIENFPTINLLQGDYKPRKKTNNNYKKRWLICVSLLTFIGLLLLLSKLVSFVILNKALASNEKEITTIYKKYFPKSVAVIAPRMRLEEKLKKLSMDNHQGVLLHLLEIVGNELIKEKDIQLNNFNFDNNQLIITLTTSSFNDLDYFIKKLKNETLQVTQQKAQSVDGTVTASLLIQRGLL